MKIKKQWVAWEEIDRILGGTWTPAAHTHPRSEITDFWDTAFWASIPDKPSTFPPSAHTLASHSTKPHSALTDVTENQHHNKVHNILSAAHGDALVASRVRGDILVANATPKWARLAKGASGTFLRSNGTDPSWAAIQAADLPAHAVRHKKEGADEILLDELGEPTANENLNVSIARHGLMPVLPNDYRKFLGGTGQWDILVSSKGIAIYVLSKVSTNLRNSNDDERISMNPSWNKLKETKMGEPAGMMTIKFEMRSSDGSLVYARIYVNGDAEGAQHSTTSTTYVEKGDNLGPFDSQDLIQIYVMAGTDEVRIQNFRFKYDRAITYFGDWKIVTPITTVLQTPFTVQNQDP